MAAEGARVVVADVNETAAKAIVEKIERQGGQGLALHVDVFYANAGWPQWKSDIEEVEEQVFDRIFDVNAKGVWLGARYALPVMKRQRRGVFLITSSTSAIRPRPGGQTYAASKGAVVTL